MAMNPDPDRNVEYMKSVWGTTSLITDYWSGKTQSEKKKILQEIMNDDHEDNLLKE
jgi:hypothetical protein